MSAMNRQKQKQVERYGRLMDKTTDDAVRIMVAKSARFTSRMMRSSSELVLDRHFDTLQRVIVREAIGLSVRSHFEGIASHPMANKTRFGLDVRQSTTFDRARGFLSGKMKLTAANIDAIEKLYKSSATRSAVDVLKVAKQSVGKAVKQFGISRAVLNEALGAAGVLADKPHLYETYARTQNALAFSAGRLEANSEPEIQAALWGYEYSAVLDGRTRPKHAALDGVTLPKESKRWKKIFPPNGYNCRCIAIEIWKDEVDDFKKQDIESVNIDGASVRGSADIGWDFSPDEILQ